MPKGSTPQKHGRRTWLPRLTKPVACFFFLLSTAAFGCGDDVSGDPGGQPGGSGPQCPAHDTDCDNISNAVESNSTNSYLGFSNGVVNANPSQARGTPSNGSLYQGINLPDNGVGYFHYVGTDATDSDDWGVLHLINMFEHGGRTWYDRVTKCTQTGPGWCGRPNRFGVGDTSLRYGGYFYPHSSHRNGLDADLRYFRNGSGAENGNFNVCTATDHNAQASLDIIGAMINQHIHHPKTGKLVLMIVNECWQIYDSNPNDHFVINFDGSGGHKDHFHLRIEDPDGSN